jgi:Ribonuclease G/E
MALKNLRSDVIELRNEGLEKDKILISLVSKLKEDEASSKAQAEAQKSEIEDLRKQLAKAKLKCVVAKADRDASEYWKNYFEKTVAELRASKERCFGKSVECVRKIKTSFANVGAYSNEDNFIRVTLRASSSGSVVKPKLLRRFLVIAGTSVHSLVRGGLRPFWRRQVADMLKPWPRPKLPSLLTIRRTPRPKRV